MKRPSSVSFRTVVVVGLIAVAMYLSPRACAHPTHAATVTGPAPVTQTQPTAPEENHLLFMPTIVVGTAAPETSTCTVDHPELCRA